MSNKPTRPQPEEIEIVEKGAPIDGKPQVLDKRLFMQLQVFTNCKDLESVKDAVENSGLEAVIYEDINDPKGFALLFMSDQPNDFVEDIRDLMNENVFDSLKRKPHLTMLGRTYSIGREENLEDWILEKPKRNALNPDNEWAIWYPLRRKPEFATLSGEDHGRVLMEHAMIGMAYGRAGLAHDIRLACHGLDENDNEFIIGLVGKNLHPLSHVVQRMRKTEQTSKYIQSLGPFFVGKVFWQSPAKERI